MTQQNRLTPLDGATLIYFIYYQLLGKWPAGSKVNPFLGAMSPKRPSRFDVMLDDFENENSRFSS
jgi:hypothetical protein